MNRFTNGDVVGCHECGNPYEYKAINGGKSPHCHPYNEINNMTILSKTQKETITVLHHNRESWKLNVFRLIESGWSDNLRLGARKELQSDQVKEMKTEHPYVTIETPVQNSLLHQLPYVYMTEHERTITSYDKVVNYAISRLQEEIQELEECLLLKNYSLAQRANLEKKLESLKADLKEFRALLKHTK